MAKDEGAGAPRLRTGCKHTCMKGINCITNTVAHGYERSSFPCSIQRWR